MVDVRIEAVGPRLIAAVSREVRIGRIGEVFQEALDQVWVFLKQGDMELRNWGGHNVFLYHHPESRYAPMQVHFGVEVARRFPDDGEVRCVETPSGRAAIATHRGSYDTLKATHDAIHAFCADNGLSIGGFSLEIYGDPRPDPAETETEVVYLLATPSGAPAGP